MFLLISNRDNENVYFENSVRQIKYLYTVPSPKFKNVFLLKYFTHLSEDFSFTVQNSVPLSLCPSHSLTYLIQPVDCGVCQILKSKININII